ncbi:alpha/beta hydrolase [Dictyobacter arantiisoli]|uniref:Alpha/beta hydrolase n=1 Tax=Dictyobacter arantiisoli TaxID=2014874 RepID=A0A5A5TKQ1_9CHLR|nr:alpha/beta hydrolase [Dictyobacter arantiisoli]
MIVQAFFQQLRHLILQSFSSSHVQQERTIPFENIDTMEFPREGCTIRYWLTGPVERPFNVLTHAAGIDHREWEETIKVLAREYRVFYWDVRGHGDSRPASSPFTLARATDDLLAILEHLGAKQITLVGHSMGGNISQEVIFRVPQLVRAAILLGCTWNTQRLSFQEKWQARLGAPLLNLYPYNLLRRQSADISAERPEVRAYLYEAFGRLSKAEFTTVILQLLEGLHEEPGYQIPVPFLLLHGEHDRTGNIRKLAPIWARAEPQCEYTVVPRAGHVANIDNPQAFHQLLLDFLHRHTPLQSRS